MAVNKPSGDNARKGAVKKRSQTKTTIGGASAWAKRNKKSGEFMGLKRPGKKKKAAKKFKGGPGGEKEDDQEAHIEEESRGKEEIASGGSHGPLEMPALRRNETGLFEQRQNGAALSQL